MTESRIKYPVDTASFTRIRKDGYLYVDKTELMYRLVNENIYVFLSRPRRFGKSLLMSTLEAYFQGKRELFAGLAIERLETRWDTFPVIRFDLSMENYSSPDRIVGHLDHLLSKMERRWDCGSRGSLSSRFSDLIENIYEKTGKEVVVLIDEYDKPMLDSFSSDGSFEEVKDELRGFYSVLKGSSEHIRFVMLTGVSKFAKVSVFSGLNNLRDISMLPDYEAICGITEEEFKDRFSDSLEDFAEYHSISPDEAGNRFKTYYDGYHFAVPGKDIYNPYSVLNAFNDRQLKDYWYASGSPTYLIRLIEENGYPLSEIEGARRTGSELSDITDIGNDFVPLLYQSGYLTLKGYDKESEEYILGFPNREVHKAFWTSLSRHFFNDRNSFSPKNVVCFVRDLEEGRIDDFMVRLQSVFGSRHSEYEPRKEIHFQNMMATVAEMLGLAVRTEVHSALGRCDMEITTRNYVYIFEFKVDQPPETALRQIQEKLYSSGHLAETLSSSGRRVTLVGVSFSTETRNIGGWKVASPA